jgi:hypothetical protein
VIVWVPGASVLVDIVATPATGLNVPRAVAPSEKEIVPVMGLAVTDNVVVKVTLPGNVEGFEFDVRVRRVPLLTIWLIGVELVLGALFKSPPYTAVMG